MDKIILLDQDNNEVEFELIDTFGVDEANYAALKQIDNDLILMVELIESDGEVIFKAIEDQDELDEIIALYEDMKEDLDEYWSD